MDQQSILSAKWKSLRASKTPIGLSPREEPSKFVSTVPTRSGKKGTSKTPRVFTTVRLLPEDSYGIRQVTSKEFNAVKRRTAKAMKKVTTVLTAGTTKSKTKNSQGASTAAAATNAEETEANDEEAETEMSTAAQPAVGNRASRAVTVDSRASRAQPTDSRASRAQSSERSATRIDPRVTPTTMTGLPWRVRHRIEGRPVPKPSSHLLERPTLGNYTFTYDLTKEDEAQLRGEIPLEYSLKPQIRDRTYYQSNMGTTWVHDQDSEENLVPSEARNKAAAQEARELEQMYKDEVLLHEYLVAHSHRNTHAKNLIKSTRNILRQTGLMPANIDDDMIKYYQDLERMEHRFDPAEHFKITDEERAEARDAFSAPAVVKQSRIQPSNYHELRRKLESTRDMLKVKKKVRLITESTEDMLKEPEPPIHLFTPSFKLEAQDRERLIDEQLYREEQNSPKRRLEHDRRKRELMEAALQVYDPESEAYERTMRTVSETPSDMDSLGREPEIPTSYYYNKLTNQFQTDEGSGPNNVLHLSGLSRSRYNVFGSRPLDQANLKGPLISTVLKEMERDKVGGSPFPIKSKPKIEGALQIENKHAKGLKALENFKLSKARQRTIHHKPVITLPNLSESYDSNGVAINWAPEPTSNQNFASNLYTRKSVGPILYQTHEYLGPKPAMSPVVEPSRRKIVNGNDSLVPSRGSLHSITFETMPNKPKPKPRIPPTKKPKAASTGSKKKVPKPSNANAVTTGRKNKR